MADIAFTELKQVGVYKHLGALGPKRQHFGQATLSSGTVELDTGLKSVDYFFAQGMNNAATKGLVIEAKETMPVAGTGTITVNGQLVEEGASSADGASATFQWMAIGD